MTAQPVPTKVGTIPKYARFGEVFENVSVITSAYMGNLRLAVVLACDDGEPLSKVSLNLVDMPDLEEGWFYAGDYSETKGQPEQLEKLGVLRLRPNVSHGFGFDGWAREACLTAEYGGPA